MSEFKKWTSINKFADAYKMAQKFRIGKVTVGLKIKLHGTNAALRLEKDGIVAQKRSSDIPAGSDNAGFRAWSEKLVRNDCCIDYYQDMIIYGEWAGKGVQKTDAVSLAPKTFYVFSVYNARNGNYLHEPRSIQDFLCKVFTEESRNEMRVVPWFTVKQKFSFADQSEAQEFIDVAVQEVDKIAALDPYIKELWDIEGPGEGLVGTILEMHQHDGTEITPEFHMDYMFKIKTLEHSVQKNKNRAATGIQKPEGVDDFIDMFFTEQRFQQMLDEHCDGEADRKKTGIFMKAVMSDVHKESVNEIEAADFEFKVVPKFATNMVRDWFFKKCDEIGG